MIFSLNLKIVLVHELFPEIMILNYLSQVNNHLHVNHVSMVLDVLFEYHQVVNVSCQNQSSIMMLYFHHVQIKVMNQLTLNEKFD